MIFREQMIKNLYCNMSQNTPLGFVGTRFNLYFSNLWRVYRNIECTPSSYDTDVLIVQSEAPQRNDIAEACFYIVLHDIGIIQTFYLLFAFLASANLEGVLADDEIGLA